MTRIDASVATHIADIGRQPQTEQDRQLQSDVARAEAVESPEAAAQGPVPADDVKAAVAQLQKVIEAASNRSLDFRLNDDRAMFVEVRDLETNEVIKQIPNESVLELASRLDDLVGALVNETV